MNVVENKIDMIDQQTSTLNIDTSFSTEIPVVYDYREPELTEGTITCYTDGSKMDDKVGAGVYIPDLDGSGTSIEMSYHIGEQSTVFQAETFAVQQAAKLLKDRGTKNKTFRVAEVMTPTPLHTISTIIPKTILYFVNF